MNRVRRLTGARPPLRICIEAQLYPGEQGGVEQYIAGLAAGLSKLDDGSEEYIFLVQPGGSDWLSPHASGSCIVVEPDAIPDKLFARPGGGISGRIPIGRRTRPWPPDTSGYEKEMQPPEDGSYPLLLSDSKIEGLGADVVHFPYQRAFLTSVPSIYQPHDLQHRHFPQNFSASERATRERWYRAYCERASLVVMMSSFGKRDVASAFDVPGSKIAVVPSGSIVDAYPQPTPDEMRETASRLGLPETFLFFPAQTWPHKNHATLIDALAAVRERHGIEIPLVCSGRHAEAYEELERKVERLGLTASVMFPGYVSQRDVRCLYGLARGLIFPSLFEGWGLPISEAFSVGLPVASSTAAGLSDVVADAGLLFDPHSIDEIADAALRLWTDPGLRQQLAARGRERRRLFNVDEAALLFRAHYRRLGGRRLSAEDRALVEAPPRA
jgi:glycosyltransferase involved in cell wall biosynthesis